MSVSLDSDRVLHSCSVVWTACTSYIVSFSLMSYMVFHVNPFCCLFDLIKKIIVRAKFLFERYFVRNYLYSVF